MIKILSLLKVFFQRYFLFVKKLLPSYAQHPSVGLDIGSRFCKAVHLVKTKDGFRILNWAIEPIEGADPSPSVQKVLQKLEFQAKDVYTAVSGQGTLIRLIKMPRMLIEQIRESLILEADKYFPFPANEIYIDCQIIEDHRIKENKIPVLVAAAKKSIINDRLSLLSKLLLQAEVVSLNACAIANAVEKFHQNNGDQEGKKKEVFAVLNMGESKTTIVIFRDDAPRFTREIAIGGKHCTQRIAEIKSCSLKEAEEFQHGDHGEEAAAICKEVLQNLASEIQLSLDYFTSEDSLWLKASGNDLEHENSSRVSKIFTIGDNAACVAQTKFLSEQLDIPIQAWVPLSGLEFRDNLSQEEFLKNIHRFSIALGLAVTEND